MTHKMLSHSVIEKSVSCFGIFRSDFGELALLLRLFTENLWSLSLCQLVMREGFVHPWLWITELWPCICGIWRHVILPAEHHFAARTKWVWGFKPILVIGITSYLEWKPEITSLLTVLLLKHFCPSCFLPSCQQLLGVGTSLLPHPMLCESSQIVQNDADGHSWDQN